MTDRTLRDAIQADLQDETGFDLDRARALTQVTLDAIEAHTGGDWVIVRVDAEAKARRDIFDALTQHLDVEYAYRGHLVTVVSDGVEGPWLSVDGWAISPRRKAVDLRDTLGMVRDLDLLIDVFNETAATR